MRANPWRRALCEAPCGGEDRSGSNREGLAPAANCELVQFVSRPRNAVCFDCSGLPVLAPIQYGQLLLEASLI